MSRRDAIRRGPAGRASAVGYAGYKIDFLLVGYDPGQIYIELDVVVKADLNHVVHGVNLLLVTQLVEIRSVQIIGLAPV